MEIVRTIDGVRGRVRAARERGDSVGLVPTMGYLHEGHLSLIRRARDENDLVVVSIFVNPLQFGQGEDFERYPRDLDRDAGLAEGAGADIIFAPGVEEMYPQPPLTHVDVDRLTSGLCGASRPGHFRGVATVVTKLFNIVTPDHAYFGQKDAQQVVVIKRMVADLNIDTRIVTLPIVREADGLAMSSRNVYLGPEGRVAALALSRSLGIARRLIEGGERDASRVKEVMAAEVSAAPGTRIDYIALVSGDDLSPLERLSGEVLIALAVFIDGVRLIDNLLLRVDGDTVREA
ncbi:MAG: pantoate--beta-alanine ligase [Ignavibacteriales bacterium]